MGPPLTKSDSKLTSADPRPTFSFLQSVTCDSNSCDPESGRLVQHSPCSATTARVARLKLALKNHQCHLTQIPPWVPHSRNLFSMSRETMMKSKMDLFCSQYPAHPPCHPLLCPLTDRYLWKVFPIGRQWLGLLQRPSLHAQSFPTQTSTQPSFAVRHSSRMYMSLTLSSTLSPAPSPIRKVVVAAGFLPRLTYCGMKS